MKYLRKIITAAAVSAAAFFGTQQAAAQYWEAANQLQSLISPALSGSARYKGSVEVMGVAGVGASKLNHVEFSTSQGFQYANWFYMGAGIGVDIVHAGSFDYRRNDDDYDGPDYTGYRFGNKSTGVMLPVFTDFRFNIGTGGGSSMFIDLRLGATWLLGNNYIAAGDGWLSNQTNFYMRPAIGVRIPLNSQNPRQAFNIGVSYLLITSGNNYWYGATQSFNAVGATLSYEW